MKTSAYFVKKLQHLCNRSSNKLCCFYKSFKFQITSSFHALIFQTDPFWFQLLYFLFVSFGGYLALKISSPRTGHEKPKNFDIFFTSVSSVTVSSMTAVEMESFSNIQLSIITVLILIGGEVFTSMLGLQFQRSKFHNPSTKSNHSLELVLVSGSDSKNQKQDMDLENNETDSSGSTDSLKFAAFKALGYVVLGYLLIVHIVGSSLVGLYASLIPSARNILTQKGIPTQTFAVFTVASTFANCGFVPTNENMIVFEKNSGLLLLLIPQILIGNTLYGPSLRLVIWVLEKFTKRVEYSYLLRNSKEMGYSHLLGSVRCWFLVLTVFGFVGLQFIVFCCLEWNSQLMDGLSSYEKFVAVLFQVVNTRHAGESVFDLSAISPAILVMFVVMMYLPPYTSYWPLDEQEEEEEESKKLKKTALQPLLFSQISYLVIFIILICIVERQKLKTDPLNFNVLNVTLEVISAYGNVGYSTCYSCERQIKADSNCKDVWVGLVGKWSKLGKFILIVVMFFGRLKRFNMHGDKAWKLS